MPLRSPRKRALGLAVAAPLAVALLSYTALTQAPAPIGRQPDVETQPPPRPVAEVVGPLAPSPAPTPVPMGTARIADVDIHQGFVGPARQDRFASFQPNGVERVAENPVSTFSADVDTASYAYVRRALQMGEMPTPDAVRVEELINYFDYDHGTPPAGGAPFASRVVVTPSPWNPGNRLVQIGIEGQRVDLASVAPANLVFLIDTSGSMNEPDKLPLLKRAFALLVEEMRPQDRVSIVTYAGSAGVALEPTPASRKAKILTALEALSPGGSTAGAQGIQAAYALAEDAFIGDGTNRILLATDGDFNIGVSEPEALERLIEEKRRGGISLSILGFGTGNYDDAALQALAQAGNGNAAYIDTYLEARKVLVEELGGTLLTIAKDVKVQVEFNPRTVSEYRLIGYETRLLDREDFRNDAVDAGDIGAGHSVTALYEITPNGARGAIDPSRYETRSSQTSGDHADELGFVRIRYKAPDGDTSALIETPVLTASAVSPLDAAGDDARFAAAVAAFGQKLRGSPYLAGMDWRAIGALARSGRGEDISGRRAEFLQLVDVAAGLDAF